MNLQIFWIFISCRHYLAVLIFINAGT